MHAPSVPETCSQSVAPGSLQVDPGAPSSLDRPETNAQEATKQHRTVNTEELEHPVTFRHSGWARTRQRIRRALAAAGGRSNRLEAWDECGSHPWIVRSISQPDLYKIRAHLCHDRFCKPCASQRSATIAENLATKMAKRRHRLITLTIRSEQEPLAQLIQHLLDSFRTLRRTDLWRQRIRGGAAFLEIKYNVPLDRWHPHLHIIAEGQYIEVGHMTQAWKRITNHSCIVDVRLIKTWENAVRYVSKYASKPLSSSYVGDHDRLCEAITALTGRRLCMTFGCWRGWKLLKTQDDGPWTYLATMTEVTREAADGSLWHLDLLHRVGLTIRVHRTRPDVKPRPPPAENYLWSDRPWTPCSTAPAASCKSTSTSAPSASS